VFFCFRVLIGQSLIPAMVETTTHNTMTKLWYLHYMFRLYSQVTTITKLFLFQVFEEWLLSHGAKFPKLTMQKYDTEVFLVCLFVFGTVLKCAVVVNQNNERIYLSIMLMLQVRGVHATQDIVEDENIVEIPLKCLITVEMGKVWDVQRKSVCHA
jgi:hypothetical protein